MSQSRESRHGDVIAITGIGCRFPGGVSDVTSFWHLLSSGKDAIAEIPPDRIDLDHFFDAAPATPGRMMSRWGGYLDRIDEFDADFFGISPREAERMDPQQRLLLETAWEALEDAGQDLKRVDRRFAGVFVGQWTSDFESRLFADPEGIDFYMTTGSGRYATSGRLSYFLGFRGPSLTVDSACSSSLAAIHLAVRSIRTGESRLALVGGSNLILQPHISIAYSQSRMMAADGRCKFGDARGDGYVRSEGVGVVVLKSLHDALADGDRIYAVIRGSAVNNDGRGSGSMVRPSQSGQEELLRAAYEDAGVCPGQVAYVEAHGTGTRVGDPVELGALGAVLSEGRQPGTRAYVGSVKTNIGHTEGAAGIAGLIKTSLALHHGFIPPSIHCEQLNPAVPWDEIPCEVARRQVEWPDSSRPQLAGVSAYGITGTNSHVVLEQAPEIGATTVTRYGRNVQLLPLSANSPVALRALAKLYADLLSADAAPTLRDLCWSAATRRTTLSHRAVFVASDSAAMADALRRYASGEAAVAEGVVNVDSSPKIAFVLPGQGAQWIGMARELIAREPAFRAALERCDEAARRFVDWSILEQLAAAPDSDDFLLTRIDVIQPVLVALAIGYAELLWSVGIEPDAVVGHSMGEVAAACIAGALDLDQAMQVVCARSALMRRVSGQGAMALVDLPMAELRGRLVGLEDRIVVAASNAPRSSVISGVPEAVAAIMAGLERDGVFCRLVKVDVASHSPQMEPLAAELAMALDGLTPAPASVPIYSTALGRRAEGQALDANYWACNLRDPVLFSTAVKLLADDGVTVFLELGPHPILLPSVQQTVPTATMIACARRDESEQTAFLAMLGNLWAAGAPIDWRRVTPDGGSVVQLPLYPWQRERHWVLGAEMRPSGSAAPAISLRPDEESLSWLYRLEWQPSEAPSAADVLATGGARWLVVTNHGAIGLAVSEAFAAVGLLADVVPVRYLVTAFQEKASTARSVSGVVVLATDDQDAAFLPLRVLHSYLATNSHPRPRFWFVTFGAQSVVRGESERVSVDQAALWGAARVVAEEHPDLWGGLIDLGPSALSTDAAKWLTQSVLAPHGEDQIALRQGRRHVLRLMPASPGLASHPVRWRQDSAYLITGGLGGVGLHVAWAMAAAGARRLILLGRTALPPREQWGSLSALTDVGRRTAGVCALEAMGIAVHTPVVDAADEESLRAFRDRYVAEGWPPIRGVIHAAGTFDNRLADAMPQAAFDAVLKAKLRGAQYLDRLFPDVDLFVLFSSTGAFLPLAGQSNYAAANAGLDGLAQDRRARGLHALSIEWGIWQDTGLVADAAGQANVAELARQGVRSFAADRGARLLATLCGSTASDLAVFPVDWATFRRSRVGSTAPLFRNSIGDGGDTAVSADDLSGRLAAATPSERRRVQLHLVKDAVSRVLRISPKRIDPKKALGDLGLNSLMAIELRNRLEAALGRPLSATLAWNYPTVEAIVEFLAGEEPDIAPAMAPMLPFAEGELAASLAATASLTDETVMLALLEQAAAAAR